MIRAASTDLMTRPNSAKTPSRAAALTEAERAELHANEETISRGARAWLEMGRALSAVREKRLYRETHDNLDDYCWEKFHLHRSMVNDLMAASKRYELVKPIAGKLRIEITNESQMRRLCKCQAVDLPAVLKLAAKKIEPNNEGSRIPTAEILDEAVKQVKRGGSGLPAPSAPAVAEAKHGAGNPSDVVKAMPAWSNDDLVAVARAMYSELKTRGLIKNLDGV